MNKNIANVLYIIMYLFVGTQELEDAGQCFQNPVGSVIM